MAITGLRTTMNFAAEERPKSWQEGILRLKPNGTAPLYALTSAMKERSVDDPEYNWWEKPMQTRRSVIGAAATNSATTITLTAGAKGYKVGDVLRVEQTGELIRVSADSASDTALTVTRGFASTTAAAIDVTTAGKNPNLLCIGSAYEEGSAAPSGISFDPFKRYNYTQIYRNTLEATRTATKTRLRTADAMREAKADALETHSEDIERSFFYGVRSEGTLNGRPIRTGGGIYWTLENFAAQNVIDASTAYSSGINMENLEYLMSQMFLYGSSEKMAFGGNAAMLAIQQVVRKNSQYQISAGEKEYGMNVTRLNSPFGTLVLKTHPLMNQMLGGTTAGTAYLGQGSDLVILDMANLKYVSLAGDNTKYDPEMKTPGSDGVKGGYLTEASLQIELPETHFIIKGIKKGIADS